MKTTLNCQRESQSFLLRGHFACEIPPHRPRLRSLTMMAIARNVGGPLRTAARLATFRKHARRVRRRVHESSSVRLGPEASRCWSNRSAVHPSGLRGFERVRLFCDESRISFSDHLADLSRLGQGPALVHPPRQQSLGNYCLPRPPQTPIPRRRPRSVPPPSPARNELAAGVGWKKSAGPLPPVACRLWT